MMNDKGDFEPESKIFSELSNHSRLQILFLLQKKPITISTIAKNLKTTIQSIQGNLTRLTKSGLVEKTKDGTISLTPLGIISLIHLPSFRFLSKNQDFFSSHDFGDLPLDLKLRFGDLLDSKNSASIASTFNHVEKIVKTSKNYLNCIFTHPPILVGELMKKQLEDGVTVSILFGKNSVIPPNSELVELLGLKTHTIHPNLQKRLTERVGLNLVMNEKTSLLMFPHRGGDTDWFASFISSNSIFHNWCQEFFNYKWNLAEPIARLR